MSERATDTLLLYVPLTDPTAPYHSLSYIATHARAQGFDDIVIRDTNIEALHHLTRPDAIRALRARARAIRAALECRTALDTLEQVRYRLALQAEAITPELLADAIATLRSAEGFYDYPRYRRAVHALQNWVELQSIDGFPGQFTRGFNLRPGTLFNPSSLHDLGDPAMLQAAIGGFAAYYEEAFLPEIGHGAPALIGINITYCSQLPFALWLARRLRAVAPATLLVAGGTEVCDVYKYAGRPKFDRIFAPFDACVIGEGESAFADILGQVRDTGRIAAGSGNTILPGDATRPPIRYENIDRLVTPDFRDLDFAAYLSPERLVYYSPTRGCYWNRCTFCDYGLSFGTPTSPWRQRTVAQIVEDLRAITRTARFVYFSVDVLAPGALARLAEAILAEGIEVRWAAEIRLERKFTVETCRKLKASGCVAVSFGFESAAQRILDLMDKGTSIDATREIMAAFAEAGIAVQMMGFTGFPTETTEEAERTFAFLDETVGYWTVAGIGSFAMTPGSIVAQDAAAIGIDAAVMQPGQEFFVREYLQPDRADIDSDNRSVFEARRAALATAEFDRPFAGGIDTAHTMFYHEVRGLDFPRGVLAGSGAFRREDVLAVDGAIIAGAAFSPGLCADGDTIGDIRRRIDPNMRLTAAEFGERLAAHAPLEREPTALTLFVAPSGTLIGCDGGLEELFAFVADRERDGQATLTGLSAEEELFVRASVAAGILAPSRRSGLAPSGARP